MPKLKLSPEPTFRATVAIPVPGGKTDDVEFTFRHRTRGEVKAFLDGAAALPDAEMILQVAAAWDLAEPFDRAHVDQLVENYIGAPGAILTTYLGELTKAREKN